MPLTPETLPRHELNGLRLRVVDAADPTTVGIEGRVVVETASTLHVEDRGPAGATRVRQVPKRGTTFEFAIEATEVATAGPRAAATPEDARSEPAPGATPEDAPTESVSGATPDDGTQYVTVEGARLAARPARRTERTGDPTWR